MTWIVWAVFVLLTSGVAAWTIRRGTAFAAILGAGGCLLGAAFGLFGTWDCLVLRQLETRRELWNVPFASLSLGVDSLSAVFLVPVFLVGGIAALAALRRLPGDYAANRPHEHWLFFNATIGAAALAVSARNGVLFLFAWEAMTVASFLLVENTQRAAGARSGGWAYLVAGHIGGACLFALFALLGAERGFDFVAFKAAGMTSTAVFLLAFAGFGGKMGLAPLHAWYPESYPAAPAHVGAVLSGVVGNLGLYGLLRTLLILSGGGPPPSWWGYLLLFAGLGSALLGSARSLASGDMYRLLAWSSLENYGFMAAGAGLGVLGSASGNAVVSFLGFAAAIFHMLNHAVAKALLFLAAGTVQSRVGSRDLGAMGGLMRRLPLTGALFLTGAIGAAAIPPLNGFASEFLLLMAAYNGAAGYQPASIAAAAMVAAIAVMALAGGLGAAAYMKAFGFAFLGNPRGPGSASIAGDNRRQLAPHCALAAVVVYAAAQSPRVLEAVRPAAALLVRSWRDAGATARIRDWMSAAEPFQSAWVGSWILVGMIALVAILRMALMRGKKRAAAPTWDCGYAAPDNRMQYTPESFARPLAESFRACIAFEDRETPPSGIFPGPASFSSSTPGVDRAWGFRWLFAAVARLAGRVRILQAGQVQLYLLYMAVVLVVLLLWKL